MRKLHLGKLHKERTMIERIFQALPTQIDTTITLKYKIIIIIILFLIINNLRASGLITYLDEISINQVGY